MPSLTPLFIELHAELGPMHVNAVFIASLSRVGSLTHVWQLGDEDPFKVRETPAEIIRLIADAVMP